MDFDSGLILLLAFTAGLIHALDADHIMAVSAIAAKKLGMKAIIRLCINWSLGHGLVLFIFGSLILLFGLTIPVEISHYAEKIVALLLIAIGGWILKDLYQAGTHIHFHSHNGITRHAHWHRHDRHNATVALPEKNPAKKISADFLNNRAIKFKQVEKYQPEHSHDHSAVIVGVVHGLAGLAPLLAIIPVANQPLWLGVVYLFIFCSGVFLSMLVFGGVLEKLFRHIQNYGVVSINIVRGLLGLSSIALGITWLN